VEAGTQLPSDDLLFEKSLDTDGVLIKSSTPRLQIKSYDPSDYKNSFSMYTCPILTRYFDHGKPRTKPEVDTFISKRGTYYFNKGTPFGLFSVFLKENNAFIGQVDLVPTGKPGEVEIGWIFKKDYQNFGFCSEVITFFLMPFIQNLIREEVQSSGVVINRVIATAHPENKASARIILKAGLTFFKKELRYEGNPRNWYELNLESSNKK